MLSRLTLFGITFVVQASFGMLAALPDRDETCILLVGLRHRVVERKLSCVLLEL